MNLSERVGIQLTSGSSQNLAMTLAPWSHLYVLNESKKKAKQKSTALLRTLTTIHITKLAYSFLQALRAS